MLQGNTSKNAFVIAAPQSGSGKTILTLLLAAYFKNKGKKVQCFKGGPDYLDGTLHQKITVLPTINLDTVMMGEEGVKNTFQKYHQKADISIVEGMMGLFDGVKKELGSTAHISKTLGLPVLLVVSAKGIGYGIVALLKGLLKHDSSVNIIGVVFNNVRSEKHQQLLQEACDEVGVFCMGYLPFLQGLQIPSRHLGLATQGGVESFLQIATTEKMSLIDTQKIIQKTFVNLPLIKNQRPLLKNKPPLKKRIAVALDDAFHFYYHENLATLSQIGKVVFFSPLKDPVIPDCDFIYIGGGYPENHLSILSKNSSLQKSLLHYAKTGTKIWAECGGMMLLGKAIVAANGKKYPMANIFAFDTSMQQNRLHLGYRNLFLNGEYYWGHEFHYSTLKKLDDSLKTITTVSDINEQKTATEVFRYQNTVASYVHLYFDAPSKFINLF